MSKYAIIDLANLAHRCYHVVRGDAYTKAGLALTIIFRSVRKLHRDMNIDHVVFCSEGRSWRYDVYPAYKRKRKLDRIGKTSKEREEEEIFFSILANFEVYIATETRCTLLKSEGVEGDDFVARWIQLHPNDEHVILSGDSDFIQLLAPNVCIVDGVQERIITTKSVTDFKGKQYIFSVDPSKGKLKVGDTLETAMKKHQAAEKEQRAKHAADNANKTKSNILEKLSLEGKIKPTQAYKPVPFTFEPEPFWWRKALFIKIMRGDSGDGIFSAYPGVRYQGTKDKTGLCEAWADRDNYGFAWNNLMLQSWDKLDGVDTDGNSRSKRVRVIDEYRLNESLIDLTKQPDYVKELMDTVIVQAAQKELVSQVGVSFMKFCGKQDLRALAREASEHALYLNAPYARK